MKVLNLQCAVGHSFEGWFGSEDDYLSQQARGLLVCPLCGHAEVVRLPSAPRLNLSGAKAPVAPASASTRSTPASATAPAAAQRPSSARSPVRLTPERAQAEAVLLQAMRHVLASTEDVGPAFVEEVRRMHYGEAEPRNIRGEASPAEAESLRDEGIEVLRMPIPDGLKGPLQ